MHLHRKDSLFAVFALVFLLSLVVPQRVEAVETYNDYKHRASAMTAISADGSAFGEQASTYNGSTSFTVVDVALPGNSGLPVSIGRTHRVGGDVLTAPGLFAQWELDLPHVYGVYSTNHGWNVSTSQPEKRCSSPSQPQEIKPTVVVGIQGGTNEDDFDGSEYWSGLRLRLPNGGEESVLLATTPLTARPGASTSYRWNTAGNWYFACIPSAKNWSGEGFLAMAPDGTRYHFDWMSTRLVGTLEKPYYLGPDIRWTSVYRNRMMLYPTRIEDRFGNWVDYGWSGNQLQWIQASDGRRLTLSYITAGIGGSVGPKISEVSDGTRIWRYGYDANGLLTTVTLPDGARWLLDMKPFTLSYQAWNSYESDGCQRVSIPVVKRDFYTMTHPSGMKVVYEFAPRVHSRSRVWPKCSWAYDGVEDRNHSPGKYYHALSLVKKTVSGPGIASRNWIYRYWSSQQEGSWYDCSTCPTLKTTEVTDSAGRFTRYTFSNHYGVSEGRLLKVEEGETDTTLTTSAEYAYDTSNDTAYPNYIRSYGSPGTYRAVDPLEGIVIPLRSVTIRRDGDSFTLRNDSFDLYARPLQVSRFNSLGASRTDSTEYYDHLTGWVMGQVARQTNVQTGMTTAQVDYNTQALPWRQYAFGKLGSTTTYHPDGTVASVADGRGNVTAYPSWHRGIPTQILYPPTSESPNGSTESASVNNLGWVLSTTDENGFVTGYGYDAMGRLASLVHPIGDTQDWHPQVREFRALTAADTLPAGVSVDQWRLFEGEGNRAKFTYFDAALRPVLVHEYDVTDVASTFRSQSTRYDLFGRVAFASYPSADNVPADVGVRTTYDRHDRVVRIDSDSELNTLTTTQTYLPGLKVQVTNPRNQQTTTTFMAWDQPGYELPILSVQPEGKTIEIARHPQYGWPLSMTQRNASGTLSQARRYVYDGNAQLCKTIEPETGATVVGLDAAGNVAWSASGLQGGNYADTATCSYTEAIASGRVALRSYDARNRLTTLSFADGLGDQIHTYTPDGLTATITTFNNANQSDPVVNAYHYNKRRLVDGQGETVLQPQWYTWTLGYGYDRHGHLARHVYPTGLRVEYAPNALGQATRAGDFASQATYYPNGALKRFVYGNGIVHTMQQNARQLPARVTSSGGVNDTTYNYDANGNATNIWDLARGDHYSRWLSYDNLDRLTAAGSGSFGGDAWHRMTYDALDNLTSWKLHGVKDYAQYVYDGTTHRLNQIRDSGGATVVGFDYDAQGNVVRKNAQSYHFDQGNRLRGTLQETYRYDGHGRRVQASLPSGATTLWQYGASGQLLFSSDWDGPNYLNQETREYVHLAGSLVATIDHSWPSNAVLAVNYQHTDALGSPVAITNAQGQVTERLNYEPYGAVIGNPQHRGIGYTGHVMDGATGLTYMQQRYYDQSVGRFLSVDPISADPTKGHNFNRYWYANNNPYRYTDPDGRNVFSVGDWVDFGKDVGGLVVDQIIYVAAKINGNERVAELATEGMINGRVDAAASTAGVVSPIPGTGKAIRGTRAVSEAAGTTAKNQARDPNRIYSARELNRRAEEPGPNHNFPEIFNMDIFSRGEKKVQNNYFNKSRKGYSNDSIIYTLRGNLNGKEGTYEIATRPSISGRTELIVHRLFRPDRKN